MRAWVLTLGEVDPVELYYHQQEVEEDCRQMNKKYPGSCTPGVGGVIEWVLLGAFLVYVALVWWGGRKKKY